MNTLRITPAYLETFRNGLVEYDIQADEYEHEDYTTFRFEASAETMFSLGMWVSHHFTMEAFDRLIDPKPAQYLRNADLKIFE